MCHVLAPVVGHPGSDSYRFPSHSHAAGSSCGTTGESQPTRWIKPAASGGHPSSLCRPRASGSFTTDSSGPSEVGRVFGCRLRHPARAGDGSSWKDTTTGHGSVHFLDPLRPTVANTPSTDAFHSGCTALPAAHRASKCCTRMVSTACFVASELRVLPIVTTVDAMGPSVIEHPNTDTISTPVPGECCRRSRMLAGVMGRTGRKGSDQRRMRVHRAVAGRRRRSRERAHGSPSTTQHGMEAELVPFAPPNDGPKRGDTSSTHSLRVRLMDRGDQVHVMTMYNSALLRFLDRNRYRIFPTNYITFERTLFIVSWLRVESMWNFFVLLVPSTHPPPYSDRCDCSSCRWYRTSRQ